jgi:hypothetical protein
MIDQRCLTFAIADGHWAAHRVKSFSCLLTSMKKRKSSSRHLIDERESILPYLLFSPGRHIGCDVWHVHCRHQRACSNVTSLFTFFIVTYEIFHSKLFPLPDFPNFEISSKTARAKYFRNWRNWQNKRIWKFVAVPAGCCSLVFVCC